MKKIALIDDDKFILKMITKILFKHNIEVISFNNPSSIFFDSIKENNVFHAIITDLKLSNTNGLEVIKTIKSINENIPIILITGYGDMETVIEALRAGAYDFITKPIEKEYLVFSINRAIEKYSLFKENKTLVKNIEISQERIINLEKSLNEYREVGNKQYGIVGQSEAIRNVLKLIEIASNCDSNVLITGETGTGKELVAKAIHYNSYRKENKISVINCGAIPENLLESELFGYEKGSFTGAIKTKIGILEYTSGGTVVLDEIGDLTNYVQVKLLRAIQEKKIRKIGNNNEIDIDIRIIASTNKDLLSMVKQKSFREDLYFRLNVVPIHIQPLRERKEDILPLVKHFLDYYCKLNNKEPIVFSENNFKNLYYNEWKGNIRELQNFVERIVVSSEKGSFSSENFQTINKTSFSDDNISLKEFIDQHERAYLLEKLKKNDWKIKVTAKELDITFKTLYNKIKKYAIDIPYEDK